MGRAPAKFFLETTSTSGHFGLFAMYRIQADIQSGAKVVCKANKKSHKHFVYSFLWFSIVVRPGIEPGLF